MSGAHLLAFVLFARTLSPAAWGEFGFAHAVVLFLQGLQRAWVTIPMIAFSTGAGGWDAWRPTWLARNSALTLASVGMLAATAVLAATLPPGWLTRSLAMAVLLAGPLMLQEFCRRATVQESRWTLLVVQALAYATTLTGTAVALPAGESPWSPALGMALASTAAVLVYAVGSGQAVAARPQGPAATDDYRSFCTWATLCHLGYSGYNFGLQALLGAWAGPAALGVLQACRTLVQPVAALAAALDSLDKPRAAAALSRDGAPALRRVLLRATLLAAGLALPYLGLVALAAQPLLDWLYADRYAGHAATVWLCCLLALCTLLAQPPESGLYMARRTRTLFRVRAVAAVASLCLATALVPDHGAAGALAAMALGFALTAGLATWSLQRLPRHP